MIFWWIFATLGVLINLFSVAISYSAGDMLWVAINGTCAVFILLLMAKVVLYG